MSYLEKQFSQTPFDSIYCDIGLAVEEIVIEAYGQNHRILESNVRTIHADFGIFQLCSTPDIILDNDTVIEIKTKCKDRGTSPITNQHALQLIYYMVLHDKSNGSLVYYSPDLEFKKIHLITEYQIKLSPADRAFFKRLLMQMCQSMAELLTGQQKKPIVTTHALILKDYSRLFVQRLSDYTPLLISKWPTDLDVLMKKMH